MVTHTYSFQLVESVSWSYPYVKISIFQIMGRLTFVGSPRIYIYRYISSYTDSFRDNHFGDPLEYLVFCPKGDHKDDHVPHCTMHITQFLHLSWTKILRILISCQLFSRVIGMKFVAGKQASPVSPCFFLPKIIDIPTPWLDDLFPFKADCPDKWPLPLLYPPPSMG